MASGASEFMKVRATCKDRSFIGGGFCGCGAACTHGTEKCGKVSDLLGALGLLHVKKLWHGGAGAQGMWLGKPCTQPCFVESISGIDQERGDFIDFLHGVDTDAGFALVAFAAMLGGKKFASATLQKCCGSGLISCRAEGRRRHRLAWESAFFPKQSKMGGAISAARVANEDFVFTGVDARLLGAC